MNKIILTLLLTSILYSNENTKHSLKSNYQVIYESPKSVESFLEMLEDGKLYGRVRSNTFLLQWEKENANQKDYVLSALGGSLIYQSAMLSEFDFRIGLYYSYAQTNLAKNDISYLKAANSAFSRYDYTNYNRQYMAVVGQAYIRYSGINDTEIKLGRQLVETFYTKSNDISMIPNTFDALTLTNKSLKNTSFTTTYITQQKPRGQSIQSAPLLYGDSTYNGLLKPEWSANNDNAMHKGLTYKVLRDASKPTDAPLIIFEVQNNTLNNFMLDGAFYTVPKLLSQGMLEGSYTINLDQDFSIYQVYATLSNLIMEPVKLEVQR